MMKCTDEYLPGNTGSKNSSASMANGEDGYGLGIAIGDC